jgi:hypothetical protein
MTSDAITAAAPSSAPPPLDGSEPTRTHAWKDGSFGFHDILDAINPLQHIPVISSIYRWATGDEPGNVARFVGDALFTGPYGAASSLFSIAFREETGKDPGEMMLSLVTGSDPGGDAPPNAPAGTAVAANTDATAAPASKTDAIDAPPAAAGPALASAANEQAPATPPAAAAASPLAAPAAAPVASRPSPFISLYKSSPAAAAMPAAAHGDAAEQAFLAQRSQMQRGLARSGTGRPVNNVIPLQLTGGAHFMATARPPVAAAAASPSPASADPQAPSAPGNIAQRMLDALDKYSQMKQGQSRGEQIDLSP